MCHFAALQRKGSENKTTALTLPPEAYSYNTIRPEQDKGGQVKPLAADFAASLQKHISL